MRLSREFKMFALFFITALVVTFVRHGLKTHWESCHFDWRHTGLQQVLPRTAWREVR